MNVMAMLVVAVVSCCCFDKLHYGFVTYLICYMLISCKYIYITCYGCNMLHRLCCMSWLCNMLWPRYDRYDGFNMVNVTAIICYANVTCYGFVTFDIFKLQDELQVIHTC